MSIYKEALDKWGTDAQIDSTIDELAELIVKLRHWKRNKCLRNDVLEEIAGVEITTEQMKLVFDPENKDYSKIKAEQMRKLKRHMDKKEELINGITVG